MAKKRKMKTQTPAPAPKTEPPAAKRRGFPVIAVVFAAGFALAFLLAWVIFSPAENPKPEPPKEEAKAEARILAGDDLAEFFRAVDSQDFAAMARLGGELFQTGTVVRDAKTVLDGYSVPSFPPHRVYALFTRIGSPKSCRVLLTLDEDDKVVSFMAEETEIAG